MGTRPDLGQVRQWVNVPATVFSDDMLQGVLNAERDKQAAYCLIPTDADAFPAALTQALYRRVAREVAARGMPLGLTGDGIEYAPARLPNWDAQIEFHEAAYRVTAIA